MKAWFFIQPTKQVSPEAKFLDNIYFIVTFVDFFDSNDIGMIQLNQQRKEEIVTSDNKNVISETILTFAQGKEYFEVLRTWHIMKISSRSCFNFSCDLISHISKHFAAYWIPVCRCVTNRTIPDAPEPNIFPSCTPEYISSIGFPYNVLKCLRLRKENETEQRTTRLEQNAICNYRIRQ